MKEQNLSNHSRYVPGFHIVLLGLLIAGLVASYINLQNQPDNEKFEAKLLSLAFLCILLAAFYARSFALKAQDRAIISEEKLRYFVLAGKLPSSKISPQQYTALRFASDEEFVPLADKAAAENTSPKEIKKNIVTWKGDYHRV